MKRALTGIAMAAACAIVAGCGSGTPGDISAQAARTLQAQVEHVREVAAGGSYSQLKAAVAALKDQVEQFQRDGEVSASRAVAIEDAADKLVQDASPSPKPTPSPTTTSPTPSPTTTSPTPSPTSPSPSVVVSIDSSPSTDSGNNGNGNGQGNG